MWRMPIDLNPIKYSTGKETEATAQHAIVYIPVPSLAKIYINIDTVLDHVMEARKRLPIDERHALTVNTTGTHKCLVSKGKNVYTEGSHASQALGHTSLPTMARQETEPETPRAKCLRPNVHGKT